MGFRRVILVTVFALFACGDLAGAAETKIKPSTVNSADALTRSSSIVVRGRSLRVGQTTDAGDDDFEERVNLLTKVSKPVKLQLWRWTGKSDDYLKTVLGMKTLSGAALKAHPNYNTYLKFQVNKWYRTEKLSTYGVWERLKLNDIPAKTLRNTDEYRAYARYVNIFDRNAVRAIKALRKTPPLARSEASKREMLERAWIWGLTGKSDQFVLKALGLNIFTTKEMALYAKFEYSVYQNYLSARLHTMALRASQPV